MSFESVNNSNRKGGFTDDRIRVSLFEKTMIKELLIDDNLSDWEAAFVESLIELSHFSKKQDKKLNEIYDRVKGL